MGERTRNSPKIPLHSSTRTTGTGWLEDFLLQQQDRDLNLRNHIPITPRTEGGPFFPPRSQSFRAVTEAPWGQLVTASICCHQLKISRVFVTAKVLLSPTS